MGIPVTVGGADGGQVSEPGQLQYGPMLLGGGTSAGWRELVGWRDHPAASASDSQRPQATGAYPGAVYGESLVVTFTYLLRGNPDDKQAALDLIERWTPLDGVDRALVVDDGSGPWLRMARVIARSVPQDKGFRVGPVECSVQFLCADPRRYSLAEHRQVLTLVAAEGGLDYPLEYPLDYGTWSGGAVTLTNAGTTPAPLVATFVGPLTAPVLSSADWSVGFNINLADGESLIVDASAGTALLNGNADRFYTITNTSAPLERLQLDPGDTNVTLTAAAGTGRVLLAYRDARL